MSKEHGLKLINIQVDRMYFSFSFLKVSKVLKKTISSFIPRESKLNTWTMIYTTILIMWGFIVLASCNIVPFLENKRSRIFIWIYSETSNSEEKKIILTLCNKVHTLSDSLSLHLIFLYWKEEEENDPVKIQVCQTRLTSLTKFHTQWTPSSENHHIIKMRVSKLANHDQQSVI
jgi:hypothetical protein